MMAKNSPATEFTLRLNAERDALRGFIALLETEQQALIEGHTEQLLALSDSKTQAVHELSKLANARKQDLLAQGVKTGEGAITAWLQQHAADGLSIWQDILQLAEQLQYLNRTNGTLIQTKLRHNQQALTVLHNSASSAHGLYGADGQPHIPSSGRILGSV